MDCYQEYVSKQRQHLNGNAETAFLEFNSTEGLSRFKRFRYSSELPDDDQTDEDSVDISPNEGLLPWVQTRLIENSLKRCAELVGDSNVVMEVSKRTNNHLVMLETISRNLEHFEIASTSQFREFIPSTNLDLLILDIGKRMKEGKMEQLDEASKRCIKTALQMPIMPTKGTAQRLIEVEESVQYYMRMNKLNADSKVSALTQLIGYWTNRGPTSSVSVHEWLSIACWRLFFLKQCSSFLPNHECEEIRSFIHLRTAKHLRSKNFPEFASKHLQMGMKFPSTKHESINELVRTLLMDSKQVDLDLLYGQLEASRRMCEKKETLVEVHRLRAQVLDMSGKSLQHVEDAYRSALELETNNPRIWLDWGRYLRSHKADAAVCIAKAISLGYSGARLLMPALIQEETGVASKILDQISSAIFIPWISMLLRSITTSPLAVHVLDRIAHQEPHALLHEMWLTEQVHEFQVLKQNIRKTHGEVYDEFMHLAHVISQQSNIANWRPRSLRIPGTRRTLDYFLLRGKKCGRNTWKEEVDFHSDDGRSPVRFVYHSEQRDVQSLIRKKESLQVLSFYLLHEILILDGSMSEHFSTPSLFGISHEAILEKDMNSCSVKVLAESTPSLKSYFFSKFQDFEVLLTARTRFARQYAVHALGTILFKFPGYPEEVLIGQGVESTFVTLGLDGNHDEQDSMLVEGHVPFRLTPQLVNLMGTNGLNGSFTAALSTATRIMAKRDAKHSLITLLGKDFGEQNGDVLNESWEIRENKVTQCVAESLGVSTNHKGPAWMAWY